MRGKKEAARQGRVPTGFGKFPGPYGLRYDKGARKFEWLSGGQKQTVLRVLSACLAGRSISSITNELNDAGIRALGGGYWHRSAVQKILRNARLYAGQYVWNGIPVPGVGPEPIVTLDEVERIGQRLQRNRERSKGFGKRTLLSGRVFGECGRAYTLSRNRGCGCGGRGTSLPKPLRCEDVSIRLLKKTEGLSPQGRQRSRLQETVREVAPVRGRRDPQVTMLGFIDLESRVPPEHPLRTIKALADQALAALSPEFDRMYAEAGRPSIPPERLLKASVLIALYSVRSERAFCEELDYHLLFRWFLDMNLIEPSFDPTTFTKNRKRLLEHHVGQALFDEVVMAADRHGLLSDEHFTVDGTLIEAAASLKSFRPRDGDPPSTTDGDSGNPSVDFRGERRSNTTHQSTTDPEARLLRKGKGKEAKLVFMAHALMENRHGMLTDFQVSSATGTAERDAVPVLLEQARERGFHPRTLGGDKNYDTRECVAAMRERRVTPHVAQNTSGRRSAIDGRTARHRGYAVSQRIRKRVEEIFGWMKTVGGFRRTRYRGLDRTGLAGYLVATAYNLVRMAKLVPSGAEGLLSRQQEAIVTQAP